MRTQPEQKQFIEVEKVAYCISFAHNIRDLMKRTNVSVEHVANELNINSITLRRKFHNPYKFELLELKKIAEILNNQVSLNIFEAQILLNNNQKNNG